MRSRKRMSRSSSRKNFRRGTKINRKNNPRRPMRGGWRM